MILFLVRLRNVFDEILEPAEIAKYSDFAPNQRRYLCPVCVSACSDVGLEFHLAQLRPNAPDSVNIYCLCCDTDSPVIREDCNAQECLGNVISEDGDCLTCGR